MSYNLPKPSPARPLAASRASFAPLRVAAIAGLFFAGGSLGCQTTSTTTAYTPITGVEILSAGLVAGYGCGTGPTQVYKYLALLSYEADGGGQGPGQVWSNVFDCYTDGVFESLPPAPDSGSLSFFIRVFAYPQATFPPDLACSAGMAPCDATISALDLAAARWTTTCTAIQQLGAPVVADCTPLVPNRADAGAPPAPSPGDASVD